MIDGIELMGKVIDLLRQEIEVTSPYDVENFFDDYGSHSDMVKTGRFGGEDDL